MSFIDSSTNIGSFEERVAAVDIGSNTTSLLITDSSGQEVVRLSSATRLGFGLRSTGTFDPAAVERTLDCLDRYCDAIAENRVGRVRAVATSACRRASNFSDFAQASLLRLGHRVELIDGTEEGRLAFIGAVDRVGHLPTKTLVIDIGGGSTELAVGDGSPAAVRSLEVGALRLTEKYLTSDPPRPEELVNAIADVQDLVADACRDVPQFKRATRVIGCSGTIRTIAAVELGIAKVPNGFELTRTAAEDVFRTLATESLSDRIHNPGLSAHRADIIVAGCCIFVGILRSLEVDAITVSLGNILDGICSELRSES
jgi:exopolyphosphatase/guanosine-5'-triphosphate,3'-diphosphate pyrophosphatase